MTAPTLKTERLLLREPTAADAPEIVRLANDWEVARRLGRLPHPYGPTDATRFLKEIVGREIVWGIRRVEGDQFMGVVSLTAAKETPAGETSAGGQKNGAGSAELGYWLGRPFWGEGYATEAGRVVVNYGRERFSFLTSGHFVDNDASGRVLQKLGFRDVGRSVRASLALGRDLPHVDMHLEPGSSGY